MKKLTTLLFALLASVVGLCADTIKFDENTEIFSNPGQGFSSYSLWFNPATKVNYGAGYIRFDWETLQPVEGAYNWEPIDNALKFFSKNGIPFYFRIMCANFHGSKKYSSPQWVFEKGAKSNDFQGMEYTDRFGEKSKVHTTPHFEDEIFLAEHEKFIKALAKRYDGDPRLGGLDLGSYGNWGEWHVSGLGIKPAPLNVRKRYADMYLKNFKKSDIFFMTDDYEVLEYSLGTKKKARVGMRRDGVGSPWHFNRWIGRPPYDKIARMADVWKDKPMFFEFFCDVNSLHKKEWNIVFSCDWLLQNHVSLVNEIPLHPEQLNDPKEREAMDKVCRFAGARLVPQSAEVSYDDGKLDVKIVGENKGVSRIYLPFKMMYELRNSAGKVVFAWRSSCDPRKIFPGKFEIVDSMKVALKARETYSLSLRVFHTKKIFKDFRFAVNNLNDDGSLNLGKISLK